MWSISKIICFKGLWSIVCVVPFDALEDLCEVREYPIFELLISSQIRQYVILFYFINQQNFFIVSFKYFRSLSFTQLLESPHSLCKLEAGNINYFPFYELRPKDLRDALNIFLGSFSRIADFCLFCYKVHFDVIGARMLVDHRKW